jgi:hypothetical protein
VNVKNTTEAVMDMLSYFLSQGATQEELNALEAAMREADVELQNAA